MHDHRIALSDWPKLYDIASRVQEVDLTQPRGVVVPSSPFVTEGLTPKPFPFHEGYFSVGPEQLASARVPLRRIVGTKVEGFQRDSTNIHARRMARALLAGDEMPPLAISIFVDEDGNDLSRDVFIGDGQHRALGALMARCPLHVVVKRRTIAEARRLFENQKKARGLRSEDTLLIGSSPIALYVQDAMTNDAHPWADLVSENGSRSGTVKMNQMAFIVGMYAYNSLQTDVATYTNREQEFDQELAAQMARLVRAFRSNPDWTRGKNLRAITFAAIAVFRRSDLSTRRPRDEERWLKQMPSFDFAGKQYLKEKAMGNALVEHWNKRLPEERRVQPWLS